MVAGRKVRVQWDAGQQLKNNAKNAKIAKIAKAHLPVLGYKRVMNEMIDNHRVTETRRWKNNGYIHSVISIGFSVPPYPSSFLYPPPLKGRGQTGQIGQTGHLQ
jgi:hypothetical protein